MSVTINMQCLSFVLLSLISLKAVFDDKADKFWNTCIKLTATITCNFTS